MEEYVSVIIPYFNRIHYLRDLINSVHEYADIPFELIVHDDASVDGSTPEVFNMRNDISTLIINIGHNLGIPSSVNRLVNVASSNYIIFLNDDCKFVTSSFKNIVNTISKPYIGFLHLTESIDSHLNTKEPDFRLSGIRSGSAIAFRKDIWKEVGGWNDNFHSGVSDCAFMFNILKHGYFASSLYGKQCVINVSATIMGNKDSSMASSGYDCSYPKIFNLKSEPYDRHCKIREEECNRIANSGNQTPASLTNLGYWCDYINKLLYTKTGSTDIEKIDWEISKIHNHNKWKDLIIQEIKNGQKLI